MKRFVIGLGFVLSLQACGVSYGPAMLRGGELGASSVGSNPLATVLSEDTQLAAKHQHPIVIFDLDDTLFCTAYRNLEILKEWGATSAGAPYASRIAAIAPAQVGYSIDGALAGAGVPASLIRSADQFWTQRFFSGAYVKYDQPEPGAAAYVQAIAKSGAEVVYMTGRNASMASGTQQALQASGFPWNPSNGTTLLMKTVRGQSDPVFKAAATQTLAKGGTIVGCFDNEPANVNAFHQVAPSATVVFLKTVHAPNAPAVAAGIFQVGSFVSP